MRTRLNNKLKYVLLVLAAITIVLCVAVAIIIATINPDDYKPQIVHLVKAKTQRTLTINGNIHLTFIPRLGIEFGKVSLSEQNSNNEFAALGNVRLYLAWWPLLHKELIVDHVKVDSLRMNLMRYKNGSNNFSDLLQNQSASGPFKFDINGIRVSGSTVDWRDELKNQHLVLTDLDFQAGRLANATPGEIELHFKLISAQPKLEAQTGLTGKLLFDTESQHYALTNINAKLVGTVLNVPQIEVVARGNIDAQLHQHTVAVDAFSVSAISRNEKNNFNIKLDVPGIKFAQDKTTSEKIQLIANFQQEKDKTEIALSIPTLDGNGEAFKTDGTALSLNATRGARSIIGNITSPLNGNWINQKIMLPQITGKLATSDIKSPAKTLAVSLSGDAQADWARQNAVLNFVAQFDESHVRGKIGLDAFLPPLYAFNIDIDKLDADRYFSPVPVPKKTDTPLDLSALKNINANGTIHIGSLKFGDITSNGIKLEVKAADSKSAVR